MYKNKRKSEKRSEEYKGSGCARWMGGGERRAGERAARARGVRRRSRLICGLVARCGRGRRAQAPASDSAGARSGRRLSFICTFNTRILALPVFRWRRITRGAGPNDQTWKGWGWVLAYIGWHTLAFVALLYESVQERSALVTESHRCERVLLELV